MTSAKPPLWTPSAERANASNLTAFAVAAGRPGASYEALHAWSVAEPDAFWDAAWRFTGMVGERGDGPAFVPSPTGDPRDAVFFPSARLNIAYNLLAGPGTDPAAPAIVGRDETGSRHVLTWDALRIEVGALAAALADDGVGLGDRVVAWLPNGPEAIVAMLATASLGATFSSCSPDFGVGGVLDRFGQLAPKVLFAAPGYTYGGRWFDCAARLAEIEAGLPTVRRAVVLGDGWERYVATHRGAAIPSVTYPFDHPWYVLFSSGTTGRPKCFVHRSGGVLLKHRTEQVLHCDVRPGDTVLYFTTTGWMMWNWLVSALATGATVVCFDGSPFHPGPDALFDIVDQEGVTLLGVGAKYVESLRKEGRRPADTHELTSLRTICSTGSPLSDEGFAYVYDAIASDVHLASITGGTDLCGCFALGDPTSPVYAGELQRPALGLATDVFDDEGQSLRDQPGDRGELVCTNAFPSMPIEFLDDQDRSKYTAAYYARFANVWAHGDFASWTAHHGLVIHGRSDATLNPGGVRIGTAEIYAVVERMPEVAEALAFGQEHDGDTRIALLVRLSPGILLDDLLRSEIRRRLRTECSPRHIPGVIVAVDDLPRTRSGKLAELAVADAVNGRAVRNTDGLANPEVLATIAEIADLQT